MKKTALFAALLSAALLGACLDVPEIPPMPQETAPQEQAQPDLSELALDVQLPIYGSEEIWISADKKGKPMLVATMATWCPWCKRSLAALDATSQAYGDQVEVVGIFIDDDPALVEKVVQTHGMKTKALYQGNEAAQQLAVQGFPHIVLFDKDHHAVRVWSGYSDKLAEEYKAEIDKLLK